ncbi:hypothetical protein IM792_08725 [Mucilaginibacter sp. JRF]|uniref:outer membrane beta-barrel protein n=1 Tax=Mucilaginibacter sp. JRF TaxID=2780088 RepID=UPI001881DF11|nr:outer membrane beta-barrel protein [Mucilaginibacter sp. JRF]MBE9584528.1 hypothetical protein [Mucilaginibacter sp. JRF]
MKLYAFLLGIALPFTAIAQSNYKDGYIVKNNGDTIRGKVDLQEWAITPKTIHFNSGNGAEQYSPKTIKAFFAEPNYNYVSYTGSISNNHNKFPDVDKLRDTTTHIDTIFLRKVVDAPDQLSLFAVNDALKPRYFYSYKNEQPVELIMYNYYYQPTGGGLVDESMLREEKFFVQQLFNIARQHPEWGTFTIRDFQWLKYRQPDLEKMIYKLNGSKAKSVSTIGSRFYVGAGLLMPFTSFSGQTRFASGNADSKPGLKLAAGFDVFGNTSIQRLVFRAELGAEFSSTSNSADVINSIDDKTTQYYQIKRNAFFITPNLLFNFYSKPGLKVHAGAGLSLVYNKYSSNKIVGGEKLGDGSGFYYETYDMGTLTIALPVQLGIQFNNRFEGAIGYTMPAYINTEADYKVSASSFNVTFRYFIN